MILYHGSFVAVEKPDLIHSRENVDFRKVFYTTPLLEQAEKWCKKFKKIGKDSFVSCYEFDEKKSEILKILKFDSYSEEWLDFILNCRRCLDKSDYDLVFGGVANDKIFNTVELFFNGLIEKSVALLRLQYEKPNLQIAFRTEKALSCLQFKEVKKL